MEESSEKRRERLRAMREEAASNEDTPVAIPPDAPGFPLRSDMQQPPLSPPLPRFEFYTDPLAAFSGSQKNKKTKSSMGSSFGGALVSPARRPPCQSPPSPSWHPNHVNANPILPPAGSFSTPGLPNSAPAPAPNVNPDVPPPGGFSTPGPSHSNPHHPGILGKFYPGSFNTPVRCIPNPNSNPNSEPLHNSNPNVLHPRVIGRFYPNFTPPGSFSTPSSDDYSPNSIPQGGYSNAGPSASRPRPAFGDQQPSSAPHKYSEGGSGGFSTKSPAPYQYSGGRGSYLADSPPQRRVVGISDVQNSAWSQGSDRSWGSAKQSPGSGGRNSGTGGRGFQKSYNHVTASALTNPELFAQRSMLSDPWKNLVPVRVESVALCLNSCSGASSRDWLPSSISEGMKSPITKRVSISASGPSLAESLAASFTDAVSGEEGAELNQRVLN